MTLCVHVKLVSYQAHRSRGAGESQLNGSFTIVFHELVVADPSELPVLDLASLYQRRPSFMHLKYDSSQHAPPEPPGDPAGSLVSDQVLKTPPDY